MFQLKSWLIKVWHSIELVADDPGVEREWSDPRRGTGIKLVPRNPSDGDKASGPRETTNPRSVAS
jgi:hypothetical protein